MGRKKKKISHVPDLPEQVIITHILPRLSVKSIGRCSRVSKSWRSVFSTPEFAKAHLKFHADDPQDIIIQCMKALKILNFAGARAVSRRMNFSTFEAFTDDAVPRKVYLPLFQDHIIWSRISGSCDGLILVKTNEKYFGGILLNPINLEYVILPDEVADHYKNFRTYGLGYDNSSDDYKIVRLSDPRGTLYERIVDVYSLKSKCWKRVGHTPALHNDGRSGVFLNGCIHWMGRKFNNCPNIFTIAAFNLAREEFEQVSPPSGVVNERSSMEIKVFSGRLTLIQYLGGNCIDVWVMEEYGVQDSWTKLATINCPKKRKRDVRYEVVCMLNGDEITLERNGGQLFAYNWRTQVWRYVYIDGYRECSGIGALMTFRESILSLNPS